MSDTRSSTARRATSRVLPALAVLPGACSSASGRGGFDPGPSPATLALPMGMARAKPSLAAATFGRCAVPGPTSRSVVDGNRW